MFQWKLIPVLLHRFGIQQIIHSVATHSLLVDWITGCFTIMATICIEKVVQKGISDLVSKLSKGAWYKLLIFLIKNVWRFNSLWYKSKIFLRKNARFK